MDSHTVLNIDGSWWNILILRDIFLNHCEMLGRIKFERARKRWWKNLVFATISENFLYTLKLLLELSILKTMCKSNLKCYSCKLISFTSESDVSFKALKENRKISLKMYHNQLHLHTKFHLDNSNNKKDNYKKTKIHPGFLPERYTRFV